MTRIICVSLAIVAIAACAPTTSSTTDTASRVTMPPPMDDREDVERAVRIIQDDPEDPEFNRDELIEVLQVGNRSSRIAAVVALSPHIDSPDVMAAMKQALDEGPDLVRFNICNFCAKAGPRAKGALPNLERWATAAETHYTRAAAEIAIIRISVPNEECIPLLAKYLEQDNRMITSSVLTAFTGMPDMAERLIPIIEPLTEHNSNTIRYRAQAVLKELRGASGAR